MTTTNELADQVLELLGTARAIRYLKPDPLPHELVEKLVWAATRAPSPGNTQGWDFVVVTDAEKKARLAAAVDAAMSERVAAMPRPDRTTRLMLDGTAHLVRTLGEAPVLVLVCGRPVYPPQRPREDFVWAAIYPAAQNLLVAARALGLGTVFTTLHHTAGPVVRETLGIPDDVLVGCLIPVGWPAARFGPVNRRPVEEVLHLNGWRGGA